MASDGESVILSRLTSFCHNTPQETLNPSRTQVTSQVQEGEEKPGPDVKAGIASRANSNTVTAAGRDTTDEDRLLARES